MHAQDLESLQVEVQPVQAEATDAGSPESPVNEMLKIIPV